MIPKRRLVLDTSVWIAIERELLNVEDVIDEGDEILLPVVVLTELRTAQFMQKRSSKQRAATTAFVDSLLSVAEVVPLDVSLAESAAQLLAEVMDAGHSISDNDLYVAATARHFHAELASLDFKARFGNIAGLRIRAISGPQQNQ